MAINLQLPKVTELRPRVVVIGVGGAGGNAVNNMIASGLTGVEFVVANTDAQALSASSSEHRIQLGAHLTEGLGAGSKPEIGEAAAEEAIDEIRSQISGAHMVFIAAGMGGGTGTGAAGVIARAAKEMDILTVAIVTKPFQFEGSRRARIAEAGLDELRKYVDTLIVIPNQNLFRIANERTTFAEAFVLADQVLYSGIACIVDLIVREGLINLDFADVRTVLIGMGSAMMGTGEASGERRAILAAEEAISNPLLDDVSLRGAKGLLLSILGGRDLTLYEVDEAASRVRQEVDPEANIIVGATFDESLGDRVRVSIVASGLPSSHHAQQSGRTSAQQGRGNPPAKYAEHGTRPHEADELARVLTAALEQETPGRGAGPAHSRDRTAVAPSPYQPQANVWQSADGVTIEEGLGTLPGGQPPPLPVPAQQRSRAPEGAAAFTPAPPNEIKRPVRRMPDIDDFPAVGQRDYRAKARDPRADAGAQGTDQRGDPSGRRKPGLLERLTGIGRRENDSPDHVSGPGYPQAADGLSDPRSTGSGHASDPGQSTDDSLHRSKSGQSTELPDFFDRRRG